MDSLLQIRQGPDSIDSKGKKVDGGGGLCPDKIQSLVGMNTTWEAPPADWAKVNVDDAFSETTGTASIGVVVRDSQGKVLLSAWRFLPTCSDAEEAEILACKEGVQPLRNGFVCL